MIPARVWNRANKHTYRTFTFAVVTAEISPQQSFYNSAKIPQTYLKKINTTVYVHISVQCGTYPRPTLNTTEKCCVKQVCWKPQRKTQKSCFSERVDVASAICEQWTLTTVIKLLKTLFPEHWNTDWCGLESVMWGKRAVHSCHSESVSLGSFSY